MGVKERYEKRKQEGETSSHSGVKERYIANSINDIASSITNRLNTWLENHNNYIGNYQSRYSSRNYSYEDAYVSDSASWLDTISKQKSNFDAEADSILSYMDQYKDYLDADWMKSVRDTLSGARVNQSQIVANSTRDNEWWNSFGSEELVKQYGSAEEAYKYFQRDDGYRKKYSGMTSGDLFGLVGNLDDGEEKDWLTSYASSVDYDEKLKLDLSTATKEIEELQAVLDEYNFLIPRQSTSNPNSYENTRLAEIRKQYGSKNDLEALISEKRAYRTNAERIQKSARLAAVGDKTSESYDPEFSQHAGYVDGGKSVLVPDYKDVIYDVVNKKGDSSNIAVGQAWGRITGSEKDRIDAVGKMKDDEVALYNYYYSKHGYDAAEEYLDGIIDILNARTGEDYFAQLKGKPVAELFFGITAGVDQANSGIRSLFSDEDYIPTSAIQYTSGMVREDLKDVDLKWYNFKDGEWDDAKILGNSLGQGIYDTVTTTANMAPSMMVSAVVGMLNPAAGVAAGNLVMGASAAGNAYQEALNLGYDKGQARAYSTLVGASEVGLQYLLGGIGKLGGKLSGKAATSLASKFDSAFARLAVKYGTNMLSEGAEEYLQEILTPVFKNLALNTDEEVSLISEDAIYSFLLGAITSFGMEATGISSENGKGLIGNIRDMSSNNAKNIKAATQYGDSTKELVKEGLASDVNSESHQLAEMFDRKLSKGKSMTGYEIRQLVAANEAQFLVENYNEALPLAKQRLKELGETKNVDKIAKLVAKRASGQKLTATEISTLGKSQFGNKVAKEMAPATSDLAYKSLEARVGTDGRFGVSQSGKATIRATNEEIDIKTLDFATVGDGQATFKVADDREVSAGDIDWADGNQSYLISAVSNIENITPVAATAMVRDIVDIDKPLAPQLNGIDEAFTYGYNNYSEADLKAGKFTTDLTSVQMMSAYKLGQAARASNKSNKVQAIKRMRTAVQAATEKAVADGKETPKAKGMVITYNYGNGKVVSIEDAEIKSAKQEGGIAVAKILQQIGLGTNVEFFSSYITKDEHGNKIRVFMDDNGVEQKAYSGVYRKSDGTIRVDLNAYNGKGLTLHALSHELTHFVQQWSPEKYEVLADFLMKAYEKTDMTMHDRVLREQARLKRIRGEEVSYNEAYDEVVANAMSKMFDDGNLLNKLKELAVQDKTLVEKILEGIKEFFNKFQAVYEKQTALFHDAADIMEMKKTFEQLQNMFAEALVEASDNFQTSLIAKEVGVDVMPVEDGSQYSYSSLAEAAGFVAVENEDGTRSFTREGKKVSKVTTDDIDNSPIGAFINFSLEMGDINEADAKRQKEMFAQICTMACKTNDFAMTMQFVGSAVFTGMKANADKQYGTTYDFPSICTKTQAVIDAMSAKMMSLGRGLKTDEIVQLYDDVFASGNPVPCPECYVFSRWIGIGGLLDNIKKYQDYYGDMAVEDVAAEYRKMKAEVAKFAEEQGISFGKAKGALTSKLTKEFNKLTEKIEKAQNQGEKVKPADKQRLAELEPMMNTVKGMTWLENVYFADSSLKKVNPKFRVPDSILFDLNNGEAFATQYKEAWAFRTTQGAGYGKAITPYAEARLGEGVLVTNNTTNAIKGRAQGTLNNYFLNQKGKLDKQSRDALKRARLKQKIQAFIGGQRFQSTSDARYENASDYLLAALEMQAMGGMVQVYTKVDGAVPAFSAWGFSINQSLMPLNGGLDENGNVQDTAVGGMKPSVAFENRNKHESAGTITIGVNDNHIRAMFKQWVRDFIIPYHASGGKADVVAEFRRIQEGKEAKGKAVRSTDYSRTQSDKVLSDEVLRWQGKTDAQIQRIHEIRNARIAILTGGKPNMTVVRSNRFLSALYDKLNGGEWDGVKLAKSKVESQIFPNEFWDQTVTYDESAKIVKDYLEYCDDLGFLHRFSGMIPSNGRLVPANGYNENGERVQLTDLAYKYDENGNKTAEVEEFFWKVLTDRRMYDNNGNYLAQKVVTLNDTTAETVTGFAKNNQGREYDKAKAEALAQKILKGEQYASQETDADAEKVYSYEGLPADAFYNEDYSYIYSYDFLTAQKDMTIVDSLPTLQELQTDRKIDPEKVLAAGYKNIIEMGGTKVGNTYRIINTYTNRPLQIGKSSITHGLGAKDPNAKRTNARLAAVIGELCKNAIPISALPNTHNVRGTYGMAVLVNSHVNGKDMNMIALITVEQQNGNVQSVDFVDVAHAVSGRLVRDIEKENRSAQGTPPGTKSEWATRFSSPLKITQFLDIVNRTHQGYLSDDVISKLGEERRGPKKALYSSQETDADNAPTFYSHMGKVVEGMKQEKFGASSVISMLTGRGVKAEEIRWSGIHAFLDGKKSVTKAELLNFINSSMLQIEETMLDGSKGEPVKLPNNYRLEETENGMGDPILNLYIDDELVDTFEQIFDGSISSTGDSDIWAMNEEDLTGQILSHYAGMTYDEAYGNGSKETRWDKYTLDGGENYREILFKMPGAAYSNEAMEAHWDDRGYGVLAHARIQDFDTPYGKMLFIEEIQSDWHNEGHKKGYVDESKRLTVDNTEMRHEGEWYNLYHNGKDLHQGVSETFLKQRFRNGITEQEIHMGLVEEYNHVAVERKNGVGLVPDAPFKDNYHEYVLKRLLRMAVEQGYDSIGWTTADIQSNRWSAEYAEGYRIEYDQDIPKFLKKYGKQWGAEVGQTEIDTRGISEWEREMVDKGIIDLVPEMTTIWSMDITPAMQKSVLKDGQAMYSGHDTDYSNRSLLANAFEGITNGSEEYKLIQEYKGHIKLLNEQEEKLAKLNAEIREIRFTAGKYDAKKLRELEAEAKNVAQAIDRHDKKLLWLEASEPLRKLIERERKKEALKTIDHVKEIQQNKKLRAEQTELRHKIRKAVRDLDKILNRGNKKQNVKEDMRGFVSKALELADYLFTDHISNDELIRKGIDTDIVTASGKAHLVKETEEILTKLYDEADSLTDEEFTRLDAKRKANEEKLRDLLTAQRNRRLSVSVYKLFSDLVTEYANLNNSKQEAVKAAYDPKVDEFLRSYIGEVNGQTNTDRKTLLQNMRVADMTTDELWKLYNAYTMVLHSVRKANEFFVKGMTETIDQKVGRIVSDFGSRKIPDGKAAIVARNLANKIGWSYEKLYYALDRIGSEAFTDLIMNLANSENIVMDDVREAAAFRDEIVKKYDFNNWAVNKEIDREFLDNTGKKFKLTLGQLMSLYAYSRREGAWDHIEYGGFVFGEAALTNPKPANSYKLSKEQCEAITNTLTKEQKAYVEDMQKYLSETMGEKGNEVSMLLYGIKMFGEKNYFPIHIAGQFKAQAQESQAKQAAGFGSMSNAGFTHALTPNAKAPFVLEGFNEIWVDHVNEMSRYHGTVPALEDIRRVMNRSSYSDAYMESMSVKAVMENAFGKDAVDYFDNLYREANSGAITDKLQKNSKWLLSLFRKNSVAYSLSVLIQQPTSIIRAYAMIDKRYFGLKGFGTITTGVAKAVSDKWTKAHTNAYNEMLKYAPGVTMAKEIGGFDTATGGSIRSYLLDTNKSIKQKWKTENVLGIVKAGLDLVDDNALANLPNLADKIAWIEIWNACKRETVAKHKDLVPNSEEFMKVVGDRFTEVIRATQVYDSMFAKSPMLKSKHIGVQYLVSFMNEPNTVANMAESALRDAIRGNWKSGAKKAVVLAYSTIAVGMVKSLIYAMRDDDEDETYIEKYIEALTGSLVNDINPLSYIPVVRDISSAFQGYDIERPDMAIIVDAIEALQAIYNYANKDTENMTEAQIAELEKKKDEAAWGVAGSVAAFFGIPLKNIYRDVKAIFVNKSANAGQGSKLSLKHTFEEALNDSKYFFFRDESKSKQDKLYEAIISGDTEYENRLKNTYKTDDAYHSAVRKALRENDPRIQDAALAHINGDPSERVRIAKLIIADGFDQDDVVMAITAEIDDMTPDDSSSDTAKAKGLYKVEDFIREYANGDVATIGGIREDIIDTDKKNGKTQEEAEKGFVSDVRSKTKDAFLDGSLDNSTAKKLLMEDADMDEEEATSRVSYWSFIKKHQEYNAVFTEAHVKKYQEFAEPANISVDVYAQFINGTKGLADIKDEWGDVVVTKREQVLDVINSLPLTWQQKDALYLAYGYSESKIWDVPW